MTEQAKNKAALARNESAIDRLQLSNGQASENYERILKNLARRRKGILEHLLLQMTGAVAAAARQTTPFDGFS